MKVSLKEHKNWIISEINNDYHKETFKSFIGMLLILFIIGVILVNTYSNLSLILGVVLMIVTNTVFLIIIGTLIFFNSLYWIIYAAVHQARMDADDAKND